MKEHAINKQNNFISGWYIPEYSCDLILNEFKSRSAEHEYKPDPKNYSGLKFFSLKEDTIQHFLSDLQHCLNIYLQRYEFANNCCKFMLTDANVQEFKENNYYNVYHYENTGDKNSINRHLVFITYLNTVHTGGYTEFFYQNLKIKPEKGLTLIWPCQWTHAHRGTQTSEKKYICTGWFNFLN